MLVGCFLDDPEHDRAEQHDSGEFHLAILLARRKARPGSPRSLTAAPQWGPLVEAALQARRGELEQLWAAAERGETSAALESRLRPQLEAITAEVLGRLYPP